MFFVLILLVPADAFLFAFWEKIGMESDIYDHPKRNKERDPESYEK